MSKRWGTPTWLFFHIYVEKISPEYYNTNHKKCISIIKKICYNLPCPFCREDAVKYITRTNPIDNMITRDLLRVYLFNFHNWVNKKLNKPIFLSEKLEKYKRGVFINAYKYFCQGGRSRHCFSLNGQLSECFLTSAKCTAWGPPWVFGATCWSSFR